MTSWTLLKALGPPGENLSGVSSLKRVLLCRFVASFSYYGSVLSSSELLEKNLLCVTNADHGVQHHLVDGRCSCIPFANSDYETLLISSLGEVARKSWRPPPQLPVELGGPVLSPETL